MKIFVLDRKTWLPAPRPDVFAFFADAANLERLTPPTLHFQILTPSPIAMSPGSRIDYRLRVHGVPVRWQSEITRFEPPAVFVDEARRGPYRLWLHQHLFEERDGGTAVRDYVRWAVPFPWLGPLRRWVERDLAAIFDHRAGVLRTIFPE